MKYIAPLFQQLSINSVIVRYQAKDTLFFSSTESIFFMFRAAEILLDAAAFFGVASCFTNFDNPSP